MFNRLFRRDRHQDDTAHLLYGVIVAQARSPGFYADLGVPDSVDGRFEMLVLHMVLLMRRLKSGGEVARAIGQRVFDHFCQDMDHSLRELGVGDLKVPKQMRKVGEAYFGRAATYEPSLQSGNTALLAEAICRTVLSDEDSSGRAHQLSDYLIAAATRLGKQDESDIIGGTPDFPDIRSLVAKDSLS